MIQLNVLSGKMAGQQFVARHLPVRIGRGANCDLRLEEEGVWDQHAELTLSRAEGFQLSVQAQTVLIVNNQPTQTARLRNGDSVQIGSVRLQFWLAPTQQRGLRLREGFVWGMVAAISLVEVATAYWFL